MPSQEEQILRRFFEASRRYDLAAVAQVSTVVFHPKADGIVDDFAVLDVAGDDARAVVRIEARVRDVAGIAVRRMDVTIERRGAGRLVTAVTPRPASRTSPAASSPPPN